MGRAPPPHPGAGNCTAIFRSYANKIYIFEFYTVLCINGVKKKNFKIIMSMEKKMPKGCKNTVGVHYLFYICLHEGVRKVLSKENTSTSLSKIYLPDQFIED